MMTPISLAVWPRWVLEKKYFRIQGQEQKWVLIDHVIPCRSYPGLVHLLADIKRLEHLMLREGYAAWIAAVDRWNPLMARAVEMIGGHRYRHEDPHKFYYFRYANPSSLPASVKAAVRSWRKALHGR